MLGCSRVVQEALSCGWTAPRCDVKGSRRRRRVGMGAGWAGVGHLRMVHVGPGWGVRAHSIWICGICGIGRI